MNFIYDEILRGKTRRLHIAPVKIILYDTGFIVLAAGRGIAPLALACDCLGVRVQKVFVLIEDQPFLRFIRPVDTVSILKIFDVQLKHDHRIYISDPVVIWKWQDSEGLLLSPVEKQKLNRGRSVGVYGEINASGNSCRTVDLVESGTDFKAADEIHRDHMDGAGKVQLLGHTFCFCLRCGLWCCQCFLVIHVLPPKVNQTDAQSPPGVM